MDLQKAKIFLDKINREFSRMSKDPENIARIDVDIMQAYIRDLYDAFLSDKVTVVPRQEPVVAPTHSAHKKTVDFTPERPTPASPQQIYPEVQQPPTPRPPVVVEAPRQATPPPVQKPAEPKPVETLAPPVAPVAVEKPTAKPIVTEVYAPTMEEVQTPKPVVQAPINASFSLVTPEAEMLFEQKQARELSEKLAETPIQDLKKGIALNDRLLFNRELFGSNTQAFDEALNTLNNLSGFEQAKLWLIDNVVSRFDWTDKSRMETAKTFIRLVRRRYK